MRRQKTYFGVLAAFFMIGALNAQVSYDLGFSGKTEYVGAAGTVVEGTYLCTLKQTPTDPPGAQGWSISMTADDAEITNITLDGTTARAVCGGAECGFETSQLTTAAKAGSACEGKKGAVSAVTLALTKPLTLDASIVSSIAAITVKATIPAGGGTATLKYVNGCRGLGQPVDNVVTREGKSINPVLGTLPIQLIEKPTCVGSPVNVGFSAVRLRSADTEADPLGSVLGDEGAGGQIVIEVTKGATGTTPVYVNLVSNIPPPDDPTKDHAGPQGWSLAIGIEEPTAAGGGILKDATVAGTAAAPKPDGLWDAGFEVTALVNPDDVPTSGPLAGQRQGPGAVTGIVLSLTKKAFLPPKGAESVLKLTVEEAQPQGDDDQKARLFFKDGLKGAGQPVTAVVTVSGASLTPCNIKVADVTVTFTPSKAKKFIRGNPNNDRKVNIADPIWIVNELFFQGPPTVCQDAADANNDGRVDSSDVALLIDYQFRAGAPPSAPFPACGEDPEGDEDGLGCEESQEVCK